MARSRNESCAMADTRPKEEPTWLGYLACYTLYVLLIVGGAATLFVVLRPALLVLIDVLLGNSRANRIVYLGTITLLGLGLFIIVMAGEPYLRTGLARHQLLRRFIRLAAPVATAAVLVLLVLPFVG